MRVLMRRERILLFVVCVMGLVFLGSGLLFADTKEDAAKIADRKAALNAFFDKQFCGDCHGSNPVYNIRSARAQYDESVHKTGGNAFYSNGGVCVRCHTQEGFIAYVKDGQVDEKGYIKMPSQPSCFACHDPHQNGDMSLRTIAPATLANGQKFDKGEGNLCANCHQAVYKADIAKATPANKVLGHWGAHHGPQSDMLLGTNAYEYPGKKYWSSVHSTLTKNSCLDCHMTFPQERFAFSTDMAGHSFNIAGEVHHAPKLNVAGCLGKCHTEMKQVKSENTETPEKGFWWHQTEAIFATEAKADFDNDGKVEPLQAEVEGLLNLFVNVNGTGYLQKGELPMFKKDGTWNWTRSEVERSEKEVAALYNYKFVAEDRSRGIHNAPYTIQILYDSIASLDPGFDTSKRDTYRPPEEYKPTASN
jgi:hypothetical protein